MPADELEPPGKRPLGPSEARARALALAGAGAVGLVIVAAATSGGFALRDERGSGGLFAPKLPSYAAWILIPLLVLAVIASFAVLTQVVTGRRMSRPTRAPLWAQFLTLVLVVLSVLALQQAGILDRIQGDRGDEVAEETNRGDTARDTGEEVERSAALGVVVTIVLAVVLGAILMLTLSVLRRQGGIRAETLDPETEAILEGVDAGIDDLSNIADARAAVIACYGRMETALATAGMERRPSEAPLEFLGRVLVERDVVGSSATRLTSLFERARFSTHAIDESMRADALGALREVRVQLRSER
jgi:uncharacterized membrane protein YhaH (DUF805 family)